jgi:oligosaccharide repeat unit polymerase
MSGFIAFGIFVSLIFLYAVASSHGVGLGVLSDPSALLRVAQDSTRERYLESVQVPLYGSLASAGVLAYTTVLVMHATVGGKVRLLNVAPLAIFVLSNLIVTTRSSLVYLILVSLLAYAFAYSCANRRYPPMFNFKTVLLILGALVSLSGIFLAFQMVRFGASHSRSVWEVLGYLRRWPWGSIPSFSLWWNGDAPIEVGHLPGYYTFMGIYDNLGIDSRTQGGFSGFVYLTADEPGNVYTAFRGLVEDFGLVGGGVFLAMLGFVAGQAYRGTTLSPSVRMMVFFLTYMWLVTSFIVSYWAFAGNIFAAFLVPLLVNLFCQVDVVAGKGLKVE